LSRHRYVHPDSKRKKVAVIVAAGAFTVASAATATAAIWPGGSAAAAGVKLTDFTQAQAAVAAQQSLHTVALRAEEIAAGAAAQEAAKQQAAKQQAAKQQAAQKAARKAAQQAAASAAQRAAAAKANAAQQKAQQQLTAAENSGNPQQIAAAMLTQFGWSSDQMSCLAPLWQRESGWEVSAYNAGSGAFGIPQALPGSKMASAGPDWQTSAYTQIKWGLGYIQQVYGSPCGAWSHEEADGWYYPRTPPAGPRGGPPPRRPPAAMPARCQPGERCQPGVSPVVERTSAPRGRSPRAGHSTAPWAR
jgi:hypothetical protein